MQLKMNFMGSRDWSVVSHSRPRDSFLWKHGLLQIPVSGIQFICFIHDTIYRCYNFKLQHIRSGLSSTGDTVLHVNSDRNMAVTNSSNFIDISRDIYRQQWNKAQYGWAIYGYNVFQIATEHQLQHPTPTPLESSEVNAIAIRHILYT